MSTLKRPRAAYERDLQAIQSPFVAYGKPLPPLDDNIRDDGSFKPLWQQEVVDERGRKRLHGAFTGGFSAGYFNTVGSKEGWTPSTFVSSRTNRKQDGKKSVEQKPEDFMDDEDLADAAEASKLHTAADFAGLGSTQAEIKSHGVLLDLLQSEGETMGVKLLKRMGWREGQGVGPRVRRKARLGGLGQGDQTENDTHLFAPDDTSIIKFTKKEDCNGLGCDELLRPGMRDNIKADHQSEDDDADNDAEHKLGFSASMIAKKKIKKPARGGIGIGILNDTGSDDEDPYEIGPRISYNKVLGGNKKKKKVIASGVAKPVFISKKHAVAKSSAELRKCHDGRLPLDGFVLSTDASSQTFAVDSENRYAPPKIPEGWKSAKQPKSGPEIGGYTSTADAAKASKLNPASRASLLGEAALPGKSVFDFLSSATRDRIAAASGRTDLPPALGEIPQGYSLTNEERQKLLHSQIPKVDKDVAIAALGKGAVGWMPYAEDEAKRVRYRAFLEGQAGIITAPPERAPNTSNEDWLKELQEFAHCAQIFKPMTGMMATRFTSSSSATAASPSDADSKSGSVLSVPASKPEDPAEAAAKLGMFGPMTRSSKDFYPSRLLCKRFGVKPPANAQPDSGTNETAQSTSARTEASEIANAARLYATAYEDIHDRGRDSHQEPDGNSSVNREEPEEKTANIVVDSERNEALESQRAGDAVFKAIFGDDSDEE